jgi:Protein of unknown function (DUF3037)
MPADDPFAYAVLQVIPSIERGERVNVGVVLFCRRRDFLRLRWAVPSKRLSAFGDSLDLEAITAQMQTLEQIAAGNPQAGAVAELSISERFHWLVAPTSTMLVAGPVHTGISDEPETTLDRLFERLVA